MQKNISLSILLLLILASFFHSYKSEENNTEFAGEEDNVTYAGYNESEIEEEDPFKDYNFTNVLSYDDTNYTLLEKNEINFILFYSQYCYHCHKFLPTFIEAANYCKEQKLKVVFSRIDANLNEKASEAYQIRSYPTVYLVLKGKKHKYEGYRTKDALINFMNKKLNDEIFKINKLEEINEYQKITPILLLSTIKDKSSQIFKYFYDYAKNSYEYNFLSCLSEECLKKYGEDIILYKNFDEKEVSYVKSYGKLSDAKNSSIPYFISIFAMECGSMLTVDSLDALIRYNKTGFFYVRNSSDEENVKYDKLFKELGKELRKDNTYAFVCDTGEIYQSNIQDAFSIHEGDLPAVFYYQQNTPDPAAKNKLYSLRHLDMKKVSIESLMKFVIDIKKGKLKRDLYSMPVSDCKMINGMRRVVGKTFDQYVTDEKRNVFLGVVESDDYRDEDRIFLEILGNLTQKYKDLSFTYININTNEPRDLVIKEGEVPVGFLYTNAMKKKEIIRFEPKNFSEVYEEEVVSFLDKNLQKDKTKDTRKAKKKENAQTDL
jgi:protein disulfide-isomerase A1